ncbi:hypothetical protein BV22DRAFT_1197838 [Leucogyrophana mollusca]|uniref:Uncharacterized protein n=1 Tax=Leucogyrophana mollusca TaxID=85980 RepID=A0ACB8B7Y3_9AGAM|nr:hypothetical protein BV22DRAFT_1197838 [Leucogyrophana mollusca]
MHVRFTQAVLALCIAPLVIVLASAAHPLVPRQDSPPPPAITDASDADPGTTVAQSSADLGITGDPATQTTDAPDFPEPSDSDGSDTQPSNIGVTDGDTAAQSFVERVRWARQITPPASSAPDPGLTASAATPSVTPAPAPESQPVTAQTSAPGASTSTPVAAPSSSGVPASSDMGTAPATTAAPAPESTTTINTSTYFWTSLYIPPGVSTIHM